MDETMEKAMEKTMEAAATAATETAEKAATTAMTTAATTAAKSNKFFTPKRLLIGGGIALGGVGIGVAMDHWVFPAVAKAVAKGKEKRAARKAEKAAKKAEKAKKAEPAAAADAPASNPTPTDAVPAEGTVK